MSNPSVDFKGEGDFEGDTDVYSVVSWRESGTFLFGARALAVSRGLVGKVWKMQVSQ